MALALSEIYFGFQKKLLAKPTEYQPDFAAMRFLRAEISIAMR